MTSLSDKLKFRKEKHKIASQKMWNDAPWQRPGAGSVPGVAVSVDLKQP